MQIKQRVTEARIARDFNKFDRWILFWSFFIARFHQLLAVL